MDRATSDRQTISRRLKLGLVADLVIEDLDGEVGGEADRWLGAALRDEWGWTDHLGRQLGMQPSGSQSLHDTLLVIVREVDELLNNWPPLHDVTVCRPLAHEATKHLAPIELYATLLVGPPHWRRQKIEAGCTVDRLASHLQPMLEKALAAELNRVIGKWVDWDIRKLPERRKAALAAAEATQRNAPPEAIDPRVVHRRPDGRDRTERLRPLYQPRGKT